MVEAVHPFDRLVEPVAAAEGELEPFPLEYNKTKAVLLWVTRGSAHAQNNTIWPFTQKIGRGIAKENVFQVQEASQLFSLCQGLEFVHNVSLEALFC